MLTTIKTYLVTLFAMMALFAGSAQAYVVTALELAPIETDINANLAIIIPFVLGIFIAIFGAKLVFRLIKGFVSQSV